MNRLHKAWIDILKSIGVTYPKFQAGFEFEPFAKSPQANYKSLKEETDIVLLCMHTRVYNGI